MHTRTLIIFISTILLLVAISCTSKGRDSITTIIPITDSEDVTTSDHQAVGTWSAEINPDAKTFTVTPDSTRGGAYHFPLTQQFPDSLKVVDYGFTPNFWADIKLTHPMPGSIYNGFDPRVIVVVPVQSPGTYLYYPNLGVYANDSVLLDPDGYTKLFDNLGGTIPGNANPFKAYFKDQPYRRWSSTGVTEETQRWQMDISGFGGPIQFKLVVDVSTNYPNPPCPRFDNAQEPVMIDAFIGAGLSSNGGSANITVTVLDWQGQTGIGGIRVEAPDLFNGIADLTYSGSGQNSDEYIYTGIIENLLLAPTGEYTLLVATWDQNTNIYLYDEFPVSVADDFNGLLAVSVGPNTPAAANFALGTDDFEFMQFRMQATNEAARVTTLTVRFYDDTDVAGDDSGNGATTGDVTNAELYWLDDTTWTMLDDVSSPTSGVATFTFDHTVPKNVTETFKVIADIPTGASLTYLFTGVAGTDDGYNIYDEITATGVSSGAIYGVGDITGLADSSLFTKVTPIVTVVSSTVPAARSVIVGSTDVLLGKFFLTANDVEDIKISTIKIYADQDAGNMASDSAAAEDFSNIYLRFDDGGTWRETVPEGMTAGDGTPPDQVIFSGSNFLLPNEWIVPKGGSIIVEIRGDVVGSNSNTLCMGMTAAITNVVASGMSSGTSATVYDYQNDIYDQIWETPEMTVIDCGLLSVIVDPSSPLPQLLVGGVTDIELAVFRFSVTGEDQFLREGMITDEGDDNVVTVYKFYADRDGSGNPVTPFLVDTVTPSGGVATLNINNGVVLMPKEAYTRIYVKANIATIDGSTVHNGDTVRVTIADPSQDISSVGIASGMVIYGDSTISQDTSEHRAYESIPTVHLASSSPSGNLIPSANSEIAIFRIIADAAGDITMENDDSNQLVVKISTYISNYPEGTTSAVWLKNKTTGQVLDSVQYISFGTGGNGNTTTVTFDMDALDLEIPAGGYQDLGVVVDTTWFICAGDSIVAWLDDDEAINFSWGINGSGNYATADISFRGDIYAYVLVKAG